jgi:hypothetical protein
MPGLAVIETMGTVTVRRMTAERTAHVHAASIRLVEGTNPAQVGAAVTVELCGHWEHEGPCRWPHNNAIEDVAPVAAFRTVFVAAEGDVAAVHARIDRALRSSSEWTVLASGPRALTSDEETLGAKLS